jgi:acetyl esterase/lipase
MLEPVGEWATWALAPEYAPALVEPIFNVLTYGADPTGESNSREAIRAAIAAQVAAGEGTVYIPEGTYTTWPVGTGEVDGVTIPLHHSGIVIEGAGPTQTIINAYARGGQDPASLMLDRGFLFSTVGAPGPIDGITIRGIRATGNAAPNQYAGQWYGDQALNGWDIQHKCLGIFSNYTVTNIAVEDCEMDNWRGEIVYAGGGLELGAFAVRRCIIRDSNASAISMGGDVTVENCDISDSYNGVENLSMGAQSTTIRDSVIEICRDYAYGKFGIAYLGFDTASLLVEDNVIGKTVQAGVFLSECAFNVTIQRNAFEDTQGVFNYYLGTYTDPNFDDQEGRFEDILIDDNTFHAQTQNVESAIYGYTEGLDWTITNNEILTTGAFNVGIFSALAGVEGTYNIAANVIGNARPVAQSSGPRPTFNVSNTVGQWILGEQIFSYDSTAAVPFEICPAWGPVQITDSAAYAHRFNLTFPERCPTGFAFRLARTGNGSQFYGVEVVPDPAWNTFTRGYMLFAGGVLNSTKNATADFDLASFTANTVSLPTYDQNNYGQRPSATDITMRGQLSVTLSPTVAHTYNTFTGIAIGETITINHNGNVTITHTPGVIEMASGVDFVASGSGSLSATRHQDGTLLVGSHTFAEDAPIIGLLQTGDASDNVYGMDVVLVQDGDNPSATDGYYSIERRLEAGAWAEIVQVPKASVTGTRKTYTYTDTDLSHLNREEEYSYRARAVSPGTPDVVSRWSNTATKTFVDYVGTLQLRTEIYKTVGDVDLELDIYRPNNAETDRTAIVFVHGGGWTAGSKANHATHCVHFAAEGVVAVNVEYRLVAGSVDLFDQVADVRAAIRWVRENAVEYGIDPDDIVICGESAGGHLAGVAAFINTFDDLGGDQLVSSRPNRAILVNPITYLPGISWYEGHPAQVGATPVPDDTTQLTPASTGADESLRLSPMLYAAITPAPPVLFIHGDIDSNVPFAQSEDFHDLLVAASNTSTLETMVGSNHAFFIPGSGSEAEINATLAIIEAFLTPP